MSLLPSSNAPVPNTSKPVQDRKKAMVSERMLRRCKVWLDETLETEAPPQGLAPEILMQLQGESDSPASTPPVVPDDLYTAWSAVAAMTEEIRLQGRAFKQLHEDMPPVQDLAAAVSPLLAGLKQNQDRQAQECLVQAQQATLKEVLDTIVDIRDRLERGLHTAGVCLERTPPPMPDITRRWWQRQAIAVPSAPDREGREAVEAFRKGYQLGLDRLDESLRRWQVEPVECLGRSFDPSCMEAVDLEERTDVAQGTVLEVYRTGYLWNQKVYRTAQVKVAKNNGQEVSHA